MLPFAQITDKELMELLVPQVGTTDLSDPIYILPQDLSKNVSKIRNPNNNHINILHVNIRSISKNIDDLHNLICSLDVQPEIIAITETKLNSFSCLDRIQLTNYTFTHKDSLSCAGGVGLYIKNDLNFIERKDIDFLNINYESLWVNIIINKTKIITIAVIYRHPKNQINNFTENFSTILQKISTDKHQYYITGDFNININTKCSRYISNYTDMVKSFNFHNIIKLPTRVTKSSSTCIDHFYTNNKRSINKKFILLDRISDHFPLYCRLNLKYKINKIEPKYVRNFAKLDCKKLEAETFIKCQNLLATFQKFPLTSVDNEFEQLTDLLKELVDKNIPLEKLSRKHTNLKQKPWLTDEIIKATKLKNKQFKKLVKCNFSNVDLHNKYKENRNKLTYNIKKSKQRHYQKLLAKSKNNSKQTWNVINDLIKKNKKTIELPNKLQINNETITDPLLIANALNKYFSEIGNLNIGNINYNYINNNMNIWQQNSFMFYETDIQEIYTIIKNLPNKNSEGHDEIPISILKKLNNAICPILTYLFNKCIKQGQYPNILKIGKVLPIFKAGDRTHPGNFRPIIILPSINKVMEKLIFNRLKTFLHKYNIINNNQFGFRQGHSTELAVNKFIEDTLVNLNNNEACCAILLDLSKAFDSVDRTILLHKLYKYGIRSNTHTLLKSYLENRWQYVKVNKIKSQLCQCNVGVPQGSVISSLLFLIHINDIKFCTNMNVLNFADDTLIYHNTKNTNNIEQWLNKEFHNVNCWMDYNHLKLNLTKTKFIIFSPNTSKFKSLKNITLTGKNNNVIEQVNSCNYLGIIIDNKLTWKLHIENLKSKLSKIIGVLYRIRYFLNKQSLNLILHSLILSKIKYGLMCYGRANKSTINPINILLNRALRCINFLKTQDKRTTLIYHEEGILNVEDLIKLELAKFCYKFERKLLPTPFSNFFIDISKIHQYNTRNSKHNFYTVKQNNKWGYNKIANLGPKVWNDIPNEIKESKSIRIFNQMYKNHLITKYK